MPYLPVGDRCRRALGAAAVVAVLTLAPAAAPAQSVPTTITYQGRLADNSPQQDPVSGSIWMRFVLYDAAVGGASVWQEPAAGGMAISVVAGIFSVQLGAAVPIPATVFTSGSDRWLEIIIDPGAPTQEILAPRQKLAATAYAVQASKADVATSAISADSATTAASATMASDSAALGGIGPSGWQQALDSNCSSGEYLAGFSAGGSPQCSTPSAQPTVPLTLAGNSSQPILLVSQSGPWHAIRGEVLASGSPSSTAIRGQNDAGGYGGYFTTGGTGTAAFASTASGIGVLGRSTGGNGRGVLGEDLATTGDGFGVVGRSYSNEGTGIYAGAGHTNAGAGNTTRAIWAENLSTTGNAYGIFTTTSGGSGSAALYGQSFGGGDGLDVFVTGGGGRGGFFSLTNAANPNDALFAITNGTGRAGSFTIANAGSFNTALAASTNGYGSAVAATTSGTGAAGSFQVSNPSSINHAVYATSNGSGSTIYGHQTGSGVAGYFFVNNAASSGHGVWGTTNGSGYAVVGTTTGTGSAGYFSIDNPASNGSAVVASTDGNGRAVWGYQTGAGIGGDFQINNSANANTALRGTTNGTGPAGYFAISNGSNGATALSVSTTGTGSGGSFQIANAANTQPALATSTIGTGAAFSAQTTGTGFGAFVQVNNAASYSAAIWARSNSTWAALLADANAPVTRPLIARGAAGQTANLQEWQSSGGSTLSSVGPTGIFTGNGSGLTNVGAATVTNGVYTTGSYGNPAWIVSLAGSKISGSVASATDSVLLGGLAANQYQRVLSSSACSAGQFYSAIAADGTATCSAISAPLALTGNAGSPIVGGTNAGSGSGVKGSGSSGAGVEGESTSGVGVRASSASGIAIDAVGTGRIRSAAPIELTLAPTAMRSTDNSVQFAIDAGGVVTAYAGGVGVYRVVIPVTWPAVLFGESPKLEAVRVCYRANGAGSRIVETQVAVANEAMSVGAYLVFDATTHSSTTPDCYTVTSSTPTATADAPFVLLTLNLAGAGPGNGIAIGKIALTLTEL